MTREVLLAYIPYIKHVFFIASMTMPRMITIFSIIPFFSKLVHGQIRNSIVFSLSLILYPVIEASCPKNVGSILFVTVIIFKEVIIGALVGFLVSIIFWAVEGIGFAIDNQRGSTMGIIFDPLSGEQTSSFGSLFLQLIAVLFFTSGGFLVLLSGIFESYKIWPVFSLIPKIGNSFPSFFLSQMDYLMKLIVLFSAPVLIVIFICDLGLGLINRFAPQLNVFFLSMPIKSGLACLLIVLYLNILYFFFRGYFAGIDKTIFFLKQIVKYG